MESKKPEASTPRRFLRGRSLSKRVHLAAKRQTKTIGLPPGSLVYVGKEDAEKGKIGLTVFDEKKCIEKDLLQMEDLVAAKEEGGFVWVAVEGLQQVKAVEELGQRFGIHPLILEDILNTSQRPKTEEFEDYLFIVLKLIDYNASTDEILVEQVSLIIGPDFLLTFQEKHCSFLDRVHERLRTGKGRIRRLGVDHLAYCLIDSIVDNYFVALEKLAEKIELLEEEVVSNPNREILQVIHRMKTDMIFLRKSIWPLREVVNRLVISESAFIKEDVKPYLRDVYDHAVHIIDTLETYRDIVSGMLEIYLSSINHKLNEVMKLLTVISTIFMPLTFFTSWYGMNFKHMPELDEAWGYPLIGMLSLFVAVLMLFYFRRKEWI